MRELQSVQFSELLTAELEAGPIEGGEPVMTFRRAVGSNGCRGALGCSRRSRWDRRWTRSPLLNKWQ